MATTYIARFTPQAWIRDYACEVDPAGPTDWDVTAEILAAGTIPEADGYESDELRDADAAPDWIKDWTGPFYVEVWEAHDGELESPATPGPI